MKIIQLADAAEKSRAARYVLEQLTDWFGNPEAREHYIAAAAGQPCFAACEGDVPVGFLCLKPTGDATVELAVMGVAPDRHRGGIGRALFEAARRYAVRAGYRFMQVKTVRMGMYEDYDRTNLFYRSLGFRELECIEAVWGPENPCQIYVMALAGAEVIGLRAAVTVDRPMGSAHPDHPEMIYPVNYGFVPGVIAPDGEPQDAYVLGVDRPQDAFTGRVIAVVRRYDDCEDKWVVAPEGAAFTREEIARRIEFQEKYFDSEIISMNGEWEMGNGE